MIGFIKKDLAMIKSNFKTLGLLFVLYAIMGFYGEMDISFILLRANDLYDVRDPSWNPSRSVDNVSYHL